MDLLSFMRHVTRHYLRVQEGDAQRAATSSTVPQSIRENHGDIFHRSFPTGSDAVIVTNRHVGVAGNAK